MTDEEHGRVLPFARSGKGLEFDRVANFSDALYAIALTLIAVDLRPPALEHEGSATELLHELSGMSDQIIIFFVVFAVMGSYWLANHRFVAALRGMNASYVFWMLPYLAWVAFLPFPAALMGRYLENPAAASFFALNMAMVSLLESVLLWRAHRGNLFSEPLTPAGFRWSEAGSLSPVVVFLVSIPVMWIDTMLGLAVWGLQVPVGIYLNRYSHRALGGAGHDLRGSR